MSCFSFPTSAGQITSPVLRGDYNETFVRPLYYVFKTYFYVFYSFFYLHASVWHLVLMIFSIHFFCFLLHLVICYFFLNVHMLCLLILEFAFYFFFEILILHLLTYLLLSVSMVNLFLIPCQFFWSIFNFGFHLCAPVFCYV